MCVCVGVCASLSVIRGDGLWGYERVCVCLRACVCVLEAEPVENINSLLAELLRFKNSA